MVAVNLRLKWSPPKQRYKLRWLVWLRRHPSAPSSFTIIWRAQVSGLEMLDIHTSKTGNSLNLEDSPAQEVSKDPHWFLWGPRMFPICLYIISAIGFWIIFWVNLLWELFGFNFPFKTLRRSLRFIFRQSRDNKGFGTVFSIAATACQLSCDYRQSGANRRQPWEKWTGKKTAGQFRANGLGQNVRCRPWKNETSEPKSRVRLLL